MVDEENQEIEQDVEAAADEALEALNAQQAAWLEDHPWAGAAETRAEQRKAEREKKKDEKARAAAERERAAAEAAATSAVKDLLEEYKE